MAEDNPLSSLLPLLLLPPGPSIALLAVALLPGRPKLRAACVALALGSLYLSSVPATASWLRGQLEVYPPIAPAQTSAEAIVVLGADRQHGAVEYGGDTIAGLGLERLRYAAWLQKKTGLPVLTSGGAVAGEPVSEAELMRGILKEFGVEARWIEGESRNTYENALFSSRLLKGVGIGEILLVTHAWHMPRAVEAFEHAGIKATPAPTGAMNPAQVPTLQDWLPKAQSLRMTSLALHEILGRLWYRWQYYR